MRGVFCLSWLFSALSWAGTWNDALGPDSWKPPASYPIRAYSEFMPAPKEGARPYELLWETPAALKASPDWRRIARGADTFVVSWYDELRVIRPGLEEVTGQWLRRLAGRKPVAALFSAALTRTQNDRGQTPWTLLGGTGDSETEFWESFSRPRSFSAWLCGFLSKGGLVAGKCLGTSDLQALGVWVLSSHPARAAEAKLLAGKASAFPKVVLTFEPKEKWPARWLEAFEAGRLDVIPHPGTLLPERSKLISDLAGAGDSRQLALAEIFSGFTVNGDLRIPKYAELTVEESDRGRRRNAARFSRYFSTQTWSVGADVPISAFRLLFDSSPEALELYGKPLARNSEIWGSGGAPKGHWILTGPSAGKTEIERARSRLLSAGPGETFQYREVFPPLEVQGNSVEWRRPVAAWFDPLAQRLAADWSRPGRAVLSRASGQTVLTVDLDERWGVEKDLAANLDSETAGQVLRLAEFSEVSGAKLAPETAASLLGGADLGAWRKRLASKSPAAAGLVSTRIDPALSVRPITALTWGRTVGEPFEHSYWEKLVDLSEGPYVDKNNTDCVGKTLTDRCRRNHLPDLASKYLRPYYQRLGYGTFFHAFHWVTDFEFETKQDRGRTWWGGLELNRPGRPLADIERDGHKNVIVVIPGRNHDEAVILADHYDTAYMEDAFEDRGLRHAAPGADDNHSGTAALMEAAIALSGLDLKRDVWLVHLTGEEFPSDCLGARALTEALVTGTALIAGRKNPKITGLFVLDMIGHNTDRDHSPSAPSIFQIATGRGPKAAALGRLAHEVTAQWNREAPGWNRKLSRTASWERIKLSGAAVPRPRTSVLPEFRGEIRTDADPKSTLYNTDGIIFSDAGIPAVLFMENYDISRSGYHDSKDTLENIDLDYAAGMARLAIETVAQAADQ